MRYKDGDKAVVRSDLSVSYGRYYNDDNGEWNTVTTEMAELAGKEVTIILREGHTQYYVKEDGQFFRWTDGMFENFSPVEVDVSNYL